MVIWFVLMLSIVGMALATALYSNFLPYFSLLSDIKSYNMAYYGANTAIERSLSVLRYQEAWFESQWWWNKTWLYSVQSDISDFWYFLSGTTTLQRSIISRPILWTTTFPWISQWNVESYFLSWVWNDWNVLSYTTPQRIPLWVDNTSWSHAYVQFDTGHTYFSWTDIYLRLQLTPLVKNMFSTPVSTDRRLNDQNDVDGDGVSDDIIVDRWRKWIYSDTALHNFSILPRSLIESIDPNPPIPKDNDESIRESSINTLSASPASRISFGSNINPLYPDDISADEMTGHLIIGDDILFNAIGPSSFQDLLSNTVDIYDQELNLSLTKPLITMKGKIYPFLEYQINFSGNARTISQPYFIINGKAQVWEYTVQMNLRKSINKDEVLSSFTVVL